MREFHELLTTLRQTTSTTEKQQILAKYPTCKEQLRYALDPFKMFHVTSKAVDLCPGDSYTSWDQCRLLLDRLHRREVTGHAAIEAIRDNLETATMETQNAFKRIIDKDLKAGVGTSLVNKVYKKLVPTFDVQLCQKYEDLRFLPFLMTFCSRKLDGVRVLAIRHSVSDDFSFYSRKGNEFKTLTVLNDCLVSEMTDFVGVLDGEVCILNNKNQEDFTEIVSQIKRKNHTITNPKYLMFDMLSLQDFADRKSKTTFEERYAQMCLGISDHHNFQVLKQVPLPGPKSLRLWTKHANKSNWEGLILRDGEAIYEGKRTKTLLKVKKFHEHEFEIVGAQVGKDNFEGMLGAFLIKGEYEGKSITAKVGSGFKQTFERDEDGQPDYARPDPGGERVRFWESRDSSIGKIITVKFFEVSKDKTGAHSLRFPTFKWFHGKERTI